MPNTIGVAPVSIDGSNPLFGPNSPLPKADTRNGRFRVTFHVPVTRPAGIRYRIDETPILGDPESWNPVAQLEQGTDTWQTFNGTEVSVTPQGERVVVDVTLDGNGSPRSGQFARLILIKPQ